MHVRARLLLLGVSVCVLAGCAGESPAPTPPPTAAAADYQLGGAYDPAPEVGVVARDRTAAPREGASSICYVNAFQTQPGEREPWPADALLRRDGRVIADPEWPDESLLDTSSAAGRAAMVERVGGWIRGCAASGYQAVELDNLDSFTRGDDLLTLDDTVAVARELVRIAHEAGLAAAQKNTGTHAGRLHREAGFDFAVAEECAAYRECDDCTTVYGAHVIDVEYSDDLPRSFAEMCADTATPAATVLRDRELSTPTSSDHVFATCGDASG